MKGVAHMLVRSLTLLCIEHCFGRSLKQKRKYSIREAVIKKKNSKCKLFPKRGGGVDPKVYIFEILSFGKFQVSKWASGVKRLFKASFKN